MTELYAIRELEFVEDADGNLTAESPCGQYLARDDGDGLWFWHFIDGDGYYHEISDDPDSPMPNLMSREDGIAVCNAHHQASMGKWLRRVPVVEELRQVAKKQDDLRKDFSDDCDVTGCAIDRGRFDIVTDIADKLERGESLVKSEGNDAGQ
jgi:hypothetical protein